MTSSMLVPAWPRSRTGRRHDRGFRPRAAVRARVLGHGMLIISHIDNEHHLEHGLTTFAAPRPRCGCADRLRRARRGVAFGEVEDLDEGRRRLRAGDGVLAVDDEAGHAVDAEAAGVDVGGDDLLAALVAHQVAAGAKFVDADADGAFDHRLEVADVAAFLEVEPNSSPTTSSCTLLLAHSMHQAMRQHRVGCGGCARLGLDAASRPLSAIAW